MNRPKLGKWILTAGLYMIGIACLVSVTSSIIAIWFLRPWQTVGNYSVEPDSLQAFVLANPNVFYGATVAGVLVASVILALTGIAASMTGLSILMPTLLNQPTASA